MRWLFIVVALIAGSVWLWRTDTPSPDWSRPLAAGALAAAGAFLTGLWSIRGRLGLAAGAACVALLTGAAVADLTVETPGDGGAAQWWQDRPMLLQVTSGVLLLILTVLLVDKIVESHEARRWREAGRRGAILVLSVGGRGGTRIMRELPKSWHGLPGGEHAIAAAEQLRPLVQRLDDDLSRAVQLTLDTMLRAYENETLATLAFDMLSRVHELDRALERMIAHRQDARWLNSGAGSQWALVSVSWNYYRESYWAFSQVFYVAGQRAPHPGETHWHLVRGLSGEPGWREAYPL